MQKIKRVFRKRRNEPQTSSSGVHDQVTPRATTSEIDPPNTLASANATSPTTSHGWSTNGTSSSASNGLRPVDSSSHFAAAAAARAATGYSEHVADRNIKDRTPAEETIRPVEKDASALAEEERMKRIYANPHSTDDITSDFEHLTFGEPDFAVDLTGDTKRTTDTTVEERVAPAVTHETVIPVVHHVRDEVITREIHTHDVYHYIQPVIDTEVLPTKHYLQDENGELVQIPADQVPADSRVVETYNQHTEPPRLDSAVSPSHRTYNQHAEPTQFDTAVSPPQRTILPPVRSPNPA